MHTLSAIGGVGIRCIVCMLRFRCAHPPDSILMQWHVDALKIIQIMYLSKLSFLTAALEAGGAYMHARRSRHAYMQLDRHLFSASRHF